MVSAGYCFFFLFFFQFDWNEAFSVSFRVIKAKNESFLIYVNYTWKFSVARAWGNWIPFSSSISSTRAVFLLHSTKPNRYAIPHISSLLMCMKKWSNSTTEQPCDFFPPRNIQLTALTFTVELTNTNELGTPVFCSTKFCCMFNAYDISIPNSFRSNCITIVTGGSVSRCVLFPAILGWQIHLRTAGTAGEIRKERACLRACVVDRRNGCR